MKLVFLILAAATMLASIIPYARDVLKGSTKPNIVTWFTWTLLTGIATAAQLAGRQYVAAAFSASAVVETGVILVLGLRRGFVKYSAFDIVCQLSAIVGIILWQIFNSPTIGVVASVVIDFIGSLPTLRHAWLRPYEETWTSFALASLSGVLAILALSAYNWVSLTYALYIVLIDGTVTAVILGRSLVVRRPSIT